MHVENGWCPEELQDYRDDCVNTRVDERDVVSTTIYLACDVPRDSLQVIEITPALQLIQATERTSKHRPRIELDGRVRTNECSYVTERMVGGSERIDVEFVPTGEALDPLLDTSFRATTRRIMKEGDPDGAPPVLR